jgi:isoaspartyl peptidase/L-asparaginase-like protein (Ntn-hydrolase superfamily)
MRNGKTPTEACEQAVKRIAQKIPDYKNHQVGFIALNTKGEYGSYCIQPGFDFAVKSENESDLVKAESWLRTL